MSEHRCRRCGATLMTGLVATGRRACCLNATPIVGVCPTHGPLGPHHATDESSCSVDATVNTDECADDTRS